MAHSSRVFPNCMNLRKQQSRWAAAFCVLSMVAKLGQTALADWPEFRGPAGDGLVAAAGDTNLIGIPLHWSETENVKWKTEIPFRGWSTPVVMGGQVWL